MTKEEKYIKGQMECGIKVGNKVKVLRKARDYTRGWSTCWVPDMDKSVGKVLRVTVKRDERGLELSDGYWYPFFVLKKITARKGGKAKGKVATKSRK